MMRYEMTVKRPGREFSESDYDTVGDCFAEDYDGIYYTPEQIEAEGTVSQRVTLAYIMLRIRLALGWRGIDIALSVVD